MPRTEAPHPLHAILLAFPVALFTGAVLADITFLQSAEPQWTNFSAWLITGALIFGGPVVLIAAYRLFRARRIRSDMRPIFYLLAIASMWMSGLVNAFQHSRDGWSSVGALGLSLSIVSMLAALAAAWILHSRSGARA